MARDDQALRQGQWGSHWPLLGGLLALGVGAAIQGCSGGGSSHDGGGGGGGGATTTLASTVIGPAGGTVSASGVILEIPAGALSQDTTITIGQATDLDTTRLPMSARTAGQPFQFGPAGLRFSKPVKATVPANGALDLVVGLRDDASGAIELLRPQAAAGGTLTVELVHFSTSQPVASQEPAPSIGSISPATGSFVGGDTVVISGDRFRQGSPPLEVYFGGARATFANVVTSTIVAATPGVPEYATALVVMTPHGSRAGPVDVLVRNSDGPSVTLPGGFTYEPPLPGPPSHMVLTVPSYIAAGTPFTVLVTIVDAFLVPTTAGGTITLIYNGGPPGPTLTGNMTANAVNGVAVFPGLVFDKAGSSLALGAALAGFPNGSSAPFSVQPGPAQALAFLVEPSDGFTIGAMTPAVRVVALDANGNQAAWTTPITLTLGGAGGGTLRGTTSRSPVQDVATFWDLSVDQPGTYTLTAAATGLTDTTSASFTVTRTSPVWQPSDPMLSAHGAAVAASGDDGRIYVSGTRSVAGTTAVEAYDPRTRTWTTLPGFATARRRFAMASGPDSRIYVLGGIDAAGLITNAVEAWAPGTGTWAPVASMPTARAAFPAVSAADGRLYVFFGLSDNAAGVTERVEAYSPATGTWLPRSGNIQGTGATYAWSAATLGTDAHVYHLGGSRHFSVNGTLVDSSDAAEYIPAGDVWGGTVLQMPTGRWGGGALTGPDGRVYAIGGTAGLDTPLQSSSVEAWDRVAGTWTTLPSLRTPRGMVATARGADGRLYALGGTSPDGTELQTVEAYGPVFTASPANGAPGTTVVVSGTNFGPSAVVRLFWGSTSGTLVATGATDALGAITPAISFQVPAGTPSGTYTLTARDDASGFPVNVRFVVP